MSWLMFFFFFFFFLLLLLLLFSSSSSFQIPYVGSKFMYVAGIFVCGGCTFIFGYVLLVLLHVDSIG